jgi:competence protein ComEA
MDELRRHWDRLKYPLGGLVILLGVGAAYFLNQTPPVTASLLPTDQPTSAPTEVLVDVAGAVASPGIKRLPEGALVEDAIAAAGGVTAQADVARIAKELNRADKLKPNQKVYIPPVGAPAAGGADGGDPASTAEPNAKVNLNTAGLAELDSLPGVGPAIAQRIIDYREANGAFESPEELKEVPGIGDATYEKLASRISI